jgi:hypothetical protein
MWKKLLLVIFGTVVGILLSAGLLAAWRAIRPPAHTLTPGDAQRLTRMLADNPKEIFLYDAATSYRYKPNFHGFRTRATHLKNRPAVTYSHVTNSLGLLGEEEVSTDPALPKLLMLGDSLTYGVWMDFNDTFPAHPPNGRPELSDFNRGM